MLSELVAIHEARMLDRSMFALDTDALWREIDILRPGHEEEDYLMRQFFTQRFSWAIPSPRAIHEITEFADGSTILEIGAGMGLWARLLRDNGATVVATDHRPGVSHSYPKQGYVGTYTPIEEMAAEGALRRYPDADVLMLCWPPYSYDMAECALRDFQGSRVVYIGEWLGCCATAAFFSQLEEWAALQIRTIHIPQWAGIHDSLYQCRRASDYTSRS